MRLKPPLILKQLPTYIVPLIFQYFFFSVATVHIVAPIVRIGAYGLNLALYLYHKKWGVVTSGAIFVFWLLEAICGVITFRSVIISGY